MIMSQQLSQKRQTGAGKFLGNRQMFSGSIYGELTVVSEKRFPIVIACCHPLGFPFLSAADRDREDPNKLL